MHQIHKMILFLYILIVCMNFVLMDGTEKRSPLNLKGNVSPKLNYVVKDRDITEDFNKYSHEHSAVQKWRKNDAYTRKMCSMMYDKILPYVVNGSKDMDLSPSCSRALMKTLIGLKNYKLWAFQLIDSSAKLPAGILNLDAKTLGNYDECLSVNVSGSFRGQYCNVAVIPPLPERKRFMSPYAPLPEFEKFSLSVDEDSVTAEILKKLRFMYLGHFQTAVCVPSTCTKEETQMVANKLLQSFEIKADVVVTSCEVLEEKYEFSNLEISIITVLGVLLFLCITSTIADVYLKLTSNEENYKDNLSLTKRYLLCFSFYTNTKRLIAPDTSPDSIKVFHGIRVITMSWILLCHTYGMQVFEASSNMINLVEYNKNVIFNVVSEGFMAVDTFFFISAVVHAYAIMQLKDVKINYVFHILKRIVRLSIPFSFVMACVFLVPYTGSGPVWKESIENLLIKKCRDNWWANLLFINNFYTYQNQCLDWFWYIAADTQLFLISLFVIIPMRSKPRLAFTINFIILLGGMCIAEAFRILHGSIDTPTHARGHQEDYYYLIDMEYHRPYEHSSSYCIGMVVGYFLANRSYKMKIPLKINVALWLSALTLGLAVLLGVYGWNQGNVPHIIICMLYKSTKRIWWSLALGWVTIACMSGNGGIVYDILSWRGFVTLARLTYMVYLIHPIIQYIYLASTRTLIEISHRFLIYMFIGNLVISFMCAYVCSLLFESPFTALQNLLLMRRDLKKFKKSNDAEKTEEPEKFRKAGYFCFPICNAKESKIS